MNPEYITDQNRVERFLRYVLGTPGFLLLALGLSSCTDLGSPEEIASQVATDAVIIIEIGEIPGFPTSIRIEDSLGRATSSVRAGEPLWLHYTALNQTGKSQTWFKGMTYPFAQFLIKRGADTLADSFSGLAFLAVPVSGIVANGDSLTAVWRLDPARFPLNPGTYTAMAMPKYVIGTAHMPKDEIAPFLLTP